MYPNVSIPAKAPNPKHISISVITTVLIGPAFVMSAPEENTTLRELIQVPVIPSTAEKAVKK